MVTYVCVSPSNGMCNEKIEDAAWDMVLGITTLCMAGCGEMIRPGGSRRG